MTWLRSLLCWLGRHRWRVTRILKPHLFFEFRGHLGADFKCQDCGVESDWRTAERDYWKSPMAGQNENHPNVHCPCRLCERWRTT